jgi:hypothetical protein
VAVPPVSDQGADAVCFHPVGARHLVVRAMKLLDDLRRDSVGGHLFATPLALSRGGIHDEVDVLVSRRHGEQGASRRA